MNKKPVLIKKKMLQDNQLHTVQLRDTTYTLKCRESCPLSANVTIKQLTFTEFQL